jgi:N-acetylglucosaminyl-diphospho-decaprenol L-rhamnosyltransferase
VNPLTVGLVNLETELTVPDLEVIVVTYNSLGTIEACLRSVTEHGLGRGLMKVHMVDNASRDGTSEYVAGAFPTVEIHQRLINGGFAVANNIVLNRLSAPVVLLLNPDTIVRRGVIQRGVELLREQADVAVFGCRLERIDGSFDHAAKRNFPTPGQALKYFLFRGRRPQEYLSPGVDEYGAGDVDAVNGAFMLVRGSAIQAIGRLDEAYFMYGEDLDWCRRFKDGGWRICYDGSVTITHLKGATSGKYRSARLNWQFHRSMALFYSKFEGGNSSILDASVYTAIVSKFILSAIYSKVRRTLERVPA